MSDFRAAYPGYAATARLDELRATEYSYLDEGGHVYLDYTGAGLPARSQLRAHARAAAQRRVRQPALGEPNLVRVHGARRAGPGRGAALSSTPAPDEYAVIFTPNATGACRLVGESYPFGRRSRLVLTADNHNSVNGLREYAARRGAQRGVRRAERLRPAGQRPRACSPRSAAGTGRAQGCSPTRPSPTSAASGTRCPGWPGRRPPGTTCCSTRPPSCRPSQLDLSAVRPEFVALSWYKMFGFPTGVGCLLARRDALGRLRRPWFSGGTIRAVSVAGRWHQLLGDEAGFEDGTVNFLSIPDVAVGLDWISGIGIDLIGQRVGMLTAWLLECLGRLRHSSGAPMVRVYGPRTARVPRRHRGAELPRPGRPDDRRARGVAGRERGGDLAAHRVLLQPGSWRGRVRAAPPRPHQGAAVLLRPGADRRRRSRTT